MIVEILHPCGDYAAGQIVDLTLRRGNNLVRTGYARIPEHASVTPAEAAAKPKGRERQAPREQRG